MNSLKKKSFLKFSDFNEIEINFLINLSKKLKKKKKSNTETKKLKGKNIVLLFEKESTRTRCACEVASHDQGIHTTYLGPSDTHINNKESIEDTAKIFGKMFDGIFYRGDNDNNLYLLNKHSNIPVWNGLTNFFHPTQILSDLLTITENLPKDKSLKESCISFIGDSKNNISNTLIDAASIMGFNLKLVSPKKYWPKESFLKQCLKRSKKYNNIIECTDNIKEGVKNTDFIYTDVWLSMGEKKNKWSERIKDLYMYQVNKKMLELTENTNIKILHCLPAIHDMNSYLGLKIQLENKIKEGLEISNEVFNSKDNLCFQQSENKIHTIKALLISSLSN